MSLRIDRSTLNAIDRLTFKQGRTFSEVARDALRLYIDSSRDSRLTREASTPQVLGSLPSDNELRSEVVTKDLSSLLKAARDGAPEGNVVVRIHLFGIDHAEDLNGINLHALVREAGVPAPYATEIRKGMRLAEYVTRR